jgi:hypothetical protein
VRRLFLQQNDFGVPYKSTLNKVRKGVYKGKQGPFPYSCPDSPSATFTRSGKATKFTGTEKTKIQNCALVHFVNYDLIGKLR